MQRVRRSYRLDTDHRGAQHADRPGAGFIIEGGGTDRFVTDEGAVVLGRVARPEEESPALPVGFVPHWKTCPNAGDFRRRR